MKEYRIDFGVSLYCAKISPYLLKTRDRNATRASPKINACQSQEFNKTQKIKRKINKNIKLLIFFIYGFPRNIIIL